MICEGRLLLFIDPTSPKVRDLRLDGRYAMHSLVNHPSSEGGEFSLKGYAVAIDDPAMRQQAIDAACYTPTDAYVLFELLLDAALARDYDEGKVLDHSLGRPAAGARRIQPHPSGRASVGA